jgi:N-acyl-D-amino-acid deacylase
VLFDPQKVADKATIEHPERRSVGIARVWVNGQLVFTDGRSTRIRPGLTIRRSGAAGKPRPLR